MRELVQAQAQEQVAGVDVEIAALIWQHGATQGFFVGIATGLVLGILLSWLWRWLFRR